MLWQCSAVSFKIFVHIFTLVYLDLEVEIKITFKEINQKKKSTCLLPSFLFLCLTSFAFSLQVRLPDAVHNTGSADTHVSPKD